MTIGNNKNNNLLFTTNAATLPYLAWRYLYSSLPAYLNTTPTLFWLWPPSRLICPQRSCSSRGHDLQPTSVFTAAICTRWHKSKPLPNYQQIVLAYICQFDYRVLSSNYSVKQTLYRVGGKSKPPPIFQKIALKIANRKVKAWIKHYNAIRW